MNELQQAPQVRFGCFFANKKKFDRMSDLGLQLREGWNQSEQNEESQYGPEDTC
jgi:hypothetical protein